MFVPHVPYSGSLKSHLAAPSSPWVDPRVVPLPWPPCSSTRLFVAAVCRLALRVGLAGGASPPGGVAAGPLRGVLPALRDPLQPEQRRELRGGAGSRDLGARSRRALAGSAGARGPLSALARACFSAWPSGATSSPSFPSPPSWPRALRSRAPLRCARAPPWPRLAPSAISPACSGTRPTTGGRFTTWFPGGPRGRRGGRARPRAPVLLGLVTDQLPVLLGYDPGYGPLASTSRCSSASDGRGRLVARGRRPASRRAARCASASRPSWSCSCSPP